MNLISSLTRRIINKNELIVVSTICNLEEEKNKFICSYIGVGKLDILCHIVESNIVLLSYYNESTRKEYKLYLDYNCFKDGIYHYCSNSDIQYKICTNRDHDNAYEFY